MTEELINQPSSALLEATTRALAHTSTITFPFESTSINTEKIGFYNDAAFYQRFHAKETYEEFSKKISSPQEIAFLSSLERLRYHLQGIYYYQGTSTSLKEFRQNFPFFSDEEQKIPRLYEAIQSFLITTSLKEVEILNGPIKKKEEIKNLLISLPSLLHTPGLFLSTGMALLHLFRQDSSAKKEKKALSQKKEPSSFPQDKNNIPQEEKSPQESWQQTKSSEALHAFLEKSSAYTLLDTSKRFIEGAFPYSSKETFSDLSPYKIYTPHYDEYIAAEKLTSLEEKKELQKFLNEKGAPFKANTQYLAQRLYRFLHTQIPYKWAFDAEEGALNGSRLTQKIINPTFPYIFKYLDQDNSLNTAITLLIDNSGSMRGRPILLAALCSQILAETLEKCGVSIEVLGFTTTSWKGGNSFKKWIQEGKPLKPGRLNDLLHIVYKSFTTPWYRAKSSMGIMLKESILKENIDGEALLWATKRLLQQPEKRKILIVISDGAPVDDMTFAHNGGNYLEDHLKEVIRHLSHHPALELFAIGIGHDVTRFYPNAIVIKSPDLLSQTLFEELPALFTTYK